MQYKVPFNDLSQAHKIIDKELRTAINRVLDANWFIGGSEVAEFEKEFAQYNDVKYCVGVSNGLDALHLILKSLELPSRSEVILPANTFIATVLAVSYADLTPILVEPEEETGLISSSLIEAVITDKTKVIMPVHLYGSVCDMDEICAIANRYGLYIVEDNAQAQGCVYKGEKTGTFGIAAGVSFYPGKNIGAMGDAGAVLTNEKKVADRIRTLQNYGSTQKYYHDLKGFNARLDTIQAAILRVKLPYLDEWNRLRKEIASAYIDGISNPLVLKPVVKYDSVYHIFPVRVSCEHREGFRKYLEDKGIETLIHYPVSIPEQKSYEGMFNKADFPISLRLASELVSLPVFPYMTEKQVNYVIEAINMFYI